MSQLFQSYEQEFVNSYSDITRKIQSISVQSNRKQNITVEKKQLAFIDIRADLTDAQKCIKLMETQITGLPQSFKLAYQKKIRQYRKDYDDVKKKLYREEQQYSFSKSKQTILNAQLDEESTNHRERLIANGQQTTNTTYKLKQSIPVMYETLQIGDNIGVNLVNQTKQIKGMNKNLGDIRQDLTDGERKIQRMMMRIRKNKFIMLAIFALILLIAIIVLAVKLTKKK